MTYGFRFNYLSMKIAWKYSIKKSTFDLTWIYLELSEHKLSLLKIKNLHLNCEFLSELENLETEVSLKQFL